MSEAHAHVERYLNLLAVCRGEYTDDCRSRFIGDRRRTIELYGNNNATGGKTARAISLPVARAPRIERCAAWGCRWDARCTSTHLTD